jgi:hypothetical protein
MAKDTTPSLLAAGAWLFGVASVWLILVWR